MKNRKLLNLKEKKMVGQIYHHMLIFTIEGYIVCLIYSFEIYSNTK